MMCGNFHVQHNVELIPALSASEHFAVLPALFKKRTFSAFLRKMLNFLIRLMRKIYVCSLVAFLSSRIIS